MKKILLVALALTLGLSASAQMRKNVYAPEKSTKDGPAWSQIHTPFSTQDINGNPVNVADTLAAGKAIVIDYSATWCNPCYRFHNSKVLEAIHEQMDNVCVLWVESDPSTTINDIYGTGNNTQGDWTHYSDGSSVSYRIIDDASCESMIDPTGYVPAVYFIAPSGYYCHIYGETWGLYIDQNATQAISNITALINSAPQPGQAPVISSYKIPSMANKNATVSFNVNFISVDDYTVTWTFENGTPATANTASATCTWSTPGTYNVTVTVANANGSVSESGTITIADYDYYWDFENAADYSDWTLIDADGDGQNWTFDYLRGKGAGHDDSQGLLASASWTQATGALNPDNWVFTTAVTVPNDDNAKLSWFEKGQDPDYATEHYGVYVATSPNANNATLVWEGNATGEWVNHVVSLAPYKGQTVYIGLRHFNVSDMFMLDIDDIAIYAAAGAVSIENAENANINLYPNPTTGKVTIEAENFESAVVVDMTGRQVMTTTTSVIDMSNLTNGVYMFRINTANGTTTQKVVKK
jgi:PKD repeat protein